MQLLITMIAHYIFPWNTCLIQYTKWTYHFMSIYAVFFFYLNVCSSTLYLLHMFLSLSLNTELSMAGVSKIWLAGWIQSHSLGHSAAPRSGASSAASVCWTGLTCRALDVHHMRHRLQPVWVPCYAQCLPTPYAAEGPDWLEKVLLAACILYQPFGTRACGAVPD